MRSVPQSSPKSQPPAAASAPVVRQPPIPLDDGTTMLALIQALIPLGLAAVAQALSQEVTALAGCASTPKVPQLGNRQVPAAA